MIENLKPTIGRIVLYTLSERDCAQINRRRTTGASIAERMDEDKWPVGAQAHIGSTAKVGDIVPMIIVYVNAEGRVDGQAFLNGNDNFWVRDAYMKSNVEGSWHWPPRT